MQLEVCAPSLTVKTLLAQKVMVWTSGWLGSAAAGVGSGAFVAAASPPLWMTHLT